jgi:hypothetical protein
MLGSNFLGVHDVPSGNDVCGLGYIAIPKKTDREVYIADCYRRNVVTIYGGQFNPIFYDVPVSIEAIQQIKFPSESGGYGSPVLWINIPIYNKPVIIAIFKSDNDFYALQTECWRVTKSQNENFIDATFKASDGSMNFNIQTAKGVKGKYNIRLTNAEETCEYSLFVKGDVKIKATKKIQLTADEIFDVEIIDDDGVNKGHIRYEKGKGLTYEDEFENSILAKDGVIEVKTKNKSKIKQEENTTTITSPEINLVKEGAQKEPAVLGNKNVDVHKELLDALTDVSNALNTFAIATSAATFEPTLGPAANTLNTSIIKVQTKLKEIPAKIQLTKSKTVNLS